MHKHRFIVLCLATLFFVFEPSSSTNNTTIPISVSPTSTQAVPTPLVTQALTSSAASLPTTSSSSPTSPVANLPTPTTNATTNSSSPTSVAKRNNFTTTATINTTATATTPLPKPTSSASVNFTSNATTTTTPPVVRPTTSRPKKSINMKITFDIPFDEEYRDRKSKAYIDLEEKFIKALGEPFLQQAGFLGVEILSLRPGSVVCDFNVMFKETASPKADDVKKTLQEASKNGTLGGYAVKNIEIVAPTPTTPSSNEFWDKVIMDYLGGTLISFIVLVAAVGLCLILLIALICTCYHYRKLKKKTNFPKDVIINNDSAWINSNDNLLMWERNLRATEVNPGNAPNRPTNEKRP